MISEPALFEAMAQEAAFFRNVATMLGLRLRERTRRAPANRPRVVLVPIGEEGDRTVLDAIGRGLQHYAPGSEHEALAAADDIAHGAGRMRRWRDEGPGDAVLLSQNLAACAALLASRRRHMVLLARDVAALGHTHAEPILCARSL